MVYKCAEKFIHSSESNHVEKKFSTCSIHHHLNEICIDYKVIKINHVEM